MSEYKLIMQSLPDLKQDCPKLATKVTRIEVMEQRARNKYWVTLCVGREIAAGIICNSYEEFRRLAVVAEGRV